MSEGGIPKSQWRKSILSLRSDLVRVHEELDKLAANHGELPGLGVVQGQSCIQLTAWLIKVQEPPHEPAHRQQEQVTTVCW